MKIDPGKLNRRVDFERQVSPASSFTDQSWQHVVSVWASIKPVNGREAVLADSMRASLTHTVLVRWTKTLSAFGAGEWRIRYVAHGVSHTLAIVGPGRDVDTHWLFFDCIEGLADGH